MENQFSAGKGTSPERSRRFFDGLPISFMDWLDCPMSTLKHQYRLTWATGADTFKKSKPWNYPRADQRSDIPRPVFGFSRCASVVQCGLESDGLSGSLFEMDRLAKLRSRDFAQTRDNRKLRDRPRQSTVSSCARYRTTLFSNWTRRRSTFPRVKFLSRVFPNTRWKQEESSVWRHDNSGNACCEIGATV